MWAPLIACLCLLSAAPAHAQQQFRGETWEHISVQGGLRIGTDDLGFGLGVLGGYTLKQGIYVGALFDYFFGDSDSVAVGGVTVADASTSYWALMAEGGYDFGVTKGLVLRPVFSLGIHHASVEGCVDFVGCADRSDSDVGAGIGGHALYFINRQLTVGGELRAMFAGFEEVVFGIHVGGVL